MDWLFAAIIFGAIGTILLAARKSFIKWLRVVALYGPTFLSGRQRLRGSLILTTDTIQNGLALAKQAHEALWGSGWSYCVECLPSGWWIDWKSPRHTVYSYIVARDRRSGCWIVRQVPSVADRIAGGWDMVNGLLYGLPEVNASGLAMFNGWIDVTGLTYWQRWGIEQAGKC